MMLKRFDFVSLLVSTVLLGVLVAGCDGNDQTIVVFAGKGLKKPMEEIKLGFENIHKNTHVNMIYGGSETLLQTIRKTKRGDVYIPGAESHLMDVGDLMLSSRYVAKHTPVFCVRKDNLREIRSLEDILRPGVKIAIGNKEMCALGKVSEEIFDASPRRNDFNRNVAIAATTVNELLDLVLHREVDAALIWTDMRLWPEAGELLMIEIPPDINREEAISVVVLATTKDRKNADLFADFVADAGKSIFIQHGFGE